MLPYFSIVSFVTKSGLIFCRGHRTRFMRLTSSVMSLLLFYSCTWRNHLILKHRDESQHVKMASLAFYLFIFVRGEGICHRTQEAAFEKKNEVGRLLKTWLLSACCYEMNMHESWASGPLLVTSWGWGSQVWGSRGLGSCLLKCIFWGQLWRSVTPSIRNAVMRKILFNNHKIKA